MSRRVVLLTGLLAGCGGASAELAPTDGRAVLRFEPEARLEFEPVANGTEARRTVTIANDGTAPARVVLDLDALRPDAWALSERERVVPAGGSTQVDLTYAPCADTADPCACPERLDSATLGLRTLDAEVPPPVAVLARARAAAPRLSVFPPATVELEEGDVGTILLRNTGCGALRLDELTVTGVDGAPHPSAEELIIGGCDAWPCPRQDRLCAVAAEGCPDRLELAIEYDNGNQVLRDRFLLGVHSNDPLDDVRTLLVQARANDECTPVQVTVDRSSPRACVDTPVVLDVETSTGASTGVDWRFVFSPPPIPEIEVEGDQVRFVPRRGGTYILEARAQDACDASTPTLTTIRVSDGC